MNISMEPLPKIRQEDYQHSKASFLPLPSPWCPPTDNHYSDLHHHKITCWQTFYKWSCRVYFFFCLTFFCSALCLWNSPKSCTAMITIYYSILYSTIHPLSWWAGCFHLGTIMNNVAMSVPVQVTWCLGGCVFLAYISRTRIAGSEKL